MTNQMKNLLLLGTISFTVAFSLGIVVEKSVPKIAIIAGIGTISTLSSALILSKKIEQEREHIDSYTASLTSLEDQILKRKRQKKKLIQSIDSTTQLKVNIESEYNAIISEISNLQEEIKSLNTQRENLENVIFNLENKEIKKVTPKISVKPQSRPIKKNSIYYYILDGLENSINFYDKKNHGTFESYLQSLQKAAEDLWCSYRSNQVKVNYSDPSIQAAYLIRYYPHYAYMNFQILEILHSQNWFQIVTNETLEVCLFGAGPCPETVGLSKLISERYQNIKELIVNVYDIASEQWNLSRNITEKFIIPKYWSGDLKLNSNYLDLCEYNAIQSIQITVKKGRIFIFQNCLNEIYNVFTVQSNLNFLLNEMPLGSTIVIIDLCNYRQNVTIIDQLKEKVNSRSDLEFYCPDTKDTKISACFPMPQIITQNLLTGKEKLVPRSKDIDCLFIGIRKTKGKDL